ncbi:MAG: hypothetical protein H3C34_05280 [Caldilineaceae bacterium]|nr:hypothetical protein [Caldilineaceae bacterium]
MVDTRIQLSAIWIALMLVYLLGDVLRIFSGDYQRGDIDISKFTQPIWLGISVLMVIPIIMLLLSLMLPQPVNRWANIIVAVFFFLFNLVGLPTLVGTYDKFLIVVSLVFNVMTIWVAWNWAATAG